MKLVRFTGRGNVDWLATIATAETNEQITSMKLLQLRGMKKLGLPRRSANQALNRYAGTIQGDRRLIRRSPGVCAWRPLTP